jgi:hypothetical protein
MKNIEEEIFKTAYERDCHYAIQINDKIASRGWYNLVLSIRDVRLWTKGIAPHRHWRLKHVKQYFGIKGTAPKMLEQLEAMLEEYKSGKTNLTNLTD